MTRSEQRQMGASEGSPAMVGQGSGSVSLGAGGLGWLLREKVTVPERPAGYLHRPDLVAEIRPLGRRAMVLKAPGGFGKTTALAESCRELKVSGVICAWLTLDLEDAPHVLAAYLVLAFEEAGLDLWGGSAGQPLGNAWANPVEILMRGIELYGGPCVLALDELERLSDPGSIELLNTLLRWGPRNLGLAIACRELPGAFDVGPSILEGRSTLMQADRLRFSAAEVTDFVGARLSAEEAAALVQESRGWPFALRLLQNEPTDGASGGVRAGKELARQWIEARMWRGLDAADRELLLDLGAFDWMDSTLLDEVLEGHGLMERTRAIPALAGLLESVQVDARDAYRLHPLIREHCRRQRAEETPERYRLIHRRIAEALARRGETVAAMRHAVEAGEVELTGRILEDAGAVRLWLREGIGRLRAVDRYLTPEVRAQYPRLALAHCLVLMATGRLDEARPAYLAATGSAVPGRLGEPSDYELDECCVQGMLCLYGCAELGSERVTDVIADYRRFASANIDPVMRVSFELGLCIFHNLRAEFDAALTWARRAERHSGGNAYTQMSIDHYCGQVAMAQGRVSEAVALYANAHRTARKHLFGDREQAVFIEIMQRELDLERNRVSRLQRAALELPHSLREIGTPPACLAAASDTAVELTRRRKGVGPALTLLGQVEEEVRAAGLPAAERYLAGLRVALLAASGEVVEAERVWSQASLPEGDDECLDPDGQSWREMESLASARMHVYMATRRYDAGRRFADAWKSAAQARGLRRTWMRCLVLSVALEHSAGRSARAEARLTEFLRLFADTDYAGPAVRESRSLLPVVERFLEARPKSKLKEPAQRLLRMLRDDSKSWAMVYLSPREKEILERLGQMADREIAALLGISVAGVRYHVARIFAKLQVKDRLSAVKAARELPDDD